MNKLWFIIKIIFWFVKWTIIIGGFAFLEYQIQDTQKTMLTTLTPEIKNTIVTEFDDNGKAPLENMYVLRGMLSYDNKTSDNPIYIPTYYNVRKFQISSLMNAVRRGEEFERTGAVSKVKQ